VNALRLGRWLVVIGGILTVAGLVTGFAAMWDGDQGRVLNLLGLAPVGVLLAFSGLILVVLTEPRGAAPSIEPETPHDSDQPEPKP
jgi:hypothetical protein